MRVVNEAEEELSEISVILTIFLSAWGKGDDREIQMQVNAISRWLERRADRIAKEPTKRVR